MTSHAHETSSPRPPVIVAGAGIGGLTAAIALRRAGFPVRIYERASRLRAAGSGLSVMSNAVAALASLGIDLHLSKRGRNIETFRILDETGALIREQPLKAVTDALGVPSVCVTRADLQDALLAEAAGIPLALGHTVAGYEPGPDGVTVRFENGASVRGSALIGADGLHSAVRRRLVGPEETRDSGYVCWLAVTPFARPHLPAGYVGHYWGAGRRFGLIDVGHGRYYWWGTKNMPAERSRHWDGDKAEILDTYAGWADEVCDIVRATPMESVLAVPSHDRPFLERWGEGPVTLLGDAAHPMLTSLGQGSAMAIEDAVVLAGCLGAAPDDPAAAFRRYEDQRRERVRGVVAASRSVSEMEQLEDPVARRRRDDALRHADEAELREQLLGLLRWPVSSAT
ncbi:FAD-dependent monooxygenase [Streptomyces misionensis]|uniref:FAD-dependent monooxygenase n=1 Tax=Streptomyces misionensis TaxID=67331 RepID=UPI0033B526E3